MPLSSSMDYIPVMDEIFTHWSQLGEPPVLFWENAAFTVLDFQALRADLDQARSELQGKLNDLENARVILGRTRRVAGDRIAEFNRRLRAEFPTGAEFSRLPTVPNRTSGRDAFLDAMDDTLDLWKRVDALPPGPVLATPLLLMGGLSRREFAALRVTLDSAFTRRSRRETAVFSQRLLRNTLQDRAKALMVLYRRKVEALCAPGSLEVATLPRLTPRAGSSPEPVVPREEWDPREQQTGISSTAAENPDLESYPASDLPGLEYTSGNETLPVRRSPEAPRLTESLVSHALPRVAMSYTMHIHPARGHEADSRARTVIRPAPAG